MDPSDRDSEPTSAARNEETLSFGGSESAPRLGPFRVLELLGEGGMGEVYLAEQTEPIRRKVALKLIRLGRDSKRAIARFEIERQALALMNHPNIATIHEAGTTDDGRLYFAMEYVPGLPITDYCDRHRLTLEERLQLFVSVCEAIHHAHQKGIIHRDIKPSNVLAWRDGESHATKVIDFGVAKATQGHLTEKTLFTHDGQLLGTPAYMSPEQADLTAVNVDTTSDVYSLGVLLYELLVGVQPFDPKELLEGGLSTLCKMVLEVDPPKPSVRVASQGEETGSLAGNRSLDPPTWRRRLHGELDWITMRAIEKDRSRRYQSALAFAEDVQRYLQGDAVVAGPPSTGYRLRKTLGRHKAATTFAGVTLALILAFAGAMGFLWREAESARSDAWTRARELEQVTEFQAAMLAEVDTEAMGETLRAGLRRQWAAADSAAGARDDSRFADALAGVNTTDVALDVLDEHVLRRASRAAASEFADQPLVRASLQTTLGETYRTIGRYERAAEELDAAFQARRESLGEGDPSTIRAASDLGLAQVYLGRLEAGEATLQANLERAERALGGEHPETFYCLQNLGVHAMENGDFGAAEEYNRRSLEGYRRTLGTDHRETLSAINNLAATLLLARKPEEALPFMREAVDGHRRVLGEDHPETLNALGNLSHNLLELGELEEAAEHGEYALAGRTRVLGANHPKTLVTVVNLGTLAQRLGDTEKALALYERALAGRRETLGDDHPRTLNAMSHVGSLLNRLGRQEEGLERYREVTEGLARSVGEQHPNTLQMMMNTGNLLISMGRVREGLLFLEECHGHSRQAFGLESRLTLQSGILTARAMLADGRAREAETLLNPLEEPARAEFTGQTLPHLVVYLIERGEARAARGKFAAAEEDFLEAESIHATSPGSASHRSVLERLVAFYEDWQSRAPRVELGAKLSRWRTALAEASVG